MTTTILRAKQLPAPPASIVVLPQPTITYELGLTALCAFCKGRVTTFYDMRRFARRGDGYCHLCCASCYRVLAQEHADHLANTLLEDAWATCIGSLAWDLRTLRGGLLLKHWRGDELAFMKKRIRVICARIAQLKRAAFQPCDSSCWCEKHRHTVEA